MSMFQVDHNKATDFAPIPVGTYEAIISNIEIKTFSSGSRGLSATYTIRNDVDQPAQKRKIFDNAPIMESTMFKYQNWAKATAMPNGASFNTEDELMQGFMKHLKGKPLRIIVKHDTTRDKFIEQVSGVEASQLAVTGASTFNAPPVIPPASTTGGGAIVPSPVDTFNMPGLQGLTPPPTGGNATTPFPWEK